MPSSFDGHDNWFHPGCSGCGKDRCQCGAAGCSCGSAGSKLPGAFGSVPGEGSQAGCATDATSTSGGGCARCGKGDGRSCQQHAEPQPWPVDYDGSLWDTSGLQAPVEPGRPKRMCCWTCKDMADWDRRKGAWVGGWEWQLICGYSRDGGVTVVESESADDQHLGIGTPCNRPCPGETDCPPLYPGLEIGTSTYEQLQASFRNYAEQRGLSEAQTSWGLGQLKAGCIGIARAAAGSRDLGVSCWKTRGEALKELKELEALPGCCPVMYGIQLHNDNKGRDNVRSDVLEGEGGRVDLSNWDSQGPNGKGRGHFNFGVVVEDNAVLWANNMHNPDANGDEIGDTEPRAEVQEMVAVSGTNDDFDALVDNEAFNYSAWCVRCQGRFG